MRHEHAAVCTPTARYPSCSHEPAGRDSRMLPGTMLLMSPWQCGSGSGLRRCVVRTTSSCCSAASSMPWRARCACIQRAADPNLMIAQQACACHAWLLCLNQLHCITDSSGGRILHYWRARERLEAPCRRARPVLASHGAGWLAARRSHGARQRTGQVHFPHSFVAPQPCPLCLMQRSLCNSLPRGARPCPSSHSIAWTAFQFA